MTKFLDFSKILYSTFVYERILITSFLIYFCLFIYRLIEVTNAVEHYERTKMTFEISLLDTKTSVKESLKRLGIEILRI